MVRPERRVPDGSVRSGELFVEFCNAGWAEVIQALIADLPLDQLGFQEWLSAKTAPLRVDVLQALSLLDNHLEAHDSDDEHQYNEENREYSHRH